MRKTIIMGNIVFKNDTETLSLFVSVKNNSAKNAI